MQELMGQLDASNVRIGVVQARFNSEVTNRIWGACLVELCRLGANIDELIHVTVPGALEIPYALSRLQSEHDCDVLIAIGAVIRGDTYHFEVVSNESARAVMNLSLELDLPIINAIITTNTDEQAFARVQEKGIAAAQGAIEMASLDMLLSERE